ncbi:MgtC/SapB family protein [Sulfurimonas sp. HSL3-7]|uniref:MgtC/SapB family protein n=1 Tax=Sulfonitrofixus jiaomeiensis TaxID=3131938 RepID=UPI0031F962AD
MEITIIKQLGIALFVGLMIGLQREMYYHREGRSGFAGARTFTLIALFGYISAWMQASVPFFLHVSLFLFGLLVIIAYVYKTMKTDYHGATTEIASFVTYVLGMMIYFSLESYAVLIAVVMLFLLELKGALAKVEKQITQPDITSATLFLVMTFVVLPLLPDEMIGPFGVFNPYKTWLMVVLIAGISFVGYIAIKILGNKKGIYLTGIFGGLISSTAVSITLSKLYILRQSRLKNFAGGIAVASTIMYVRVLAEAAIFNPSLARMLALPYLLAAIIGFAFVGYLYNRQEPVHKVGDSALKANPLELSEALKLGLLFGIIFGSIGILQEWFGDSGVYIISFLSGLTDVDAITLSLSQLATVKITQQAAMNGIVIATSVNATVKMGIVFVLGGRRLGFVILPFYLLTVGVLLVSLALLR